MSIISFTVLSIVIIVIIYKIFGGKNNTTKKYIDTYSNISSNRRRDMCNYSHIDLDGDGSSDIHSYDTKPITTIRKSYPKGQHQFKHSINDDYYYIPTDYGCKRPIQTTDEHHRDFFSFRDTLCDNTSIRYDPVDKIANMKLSGLLNKSSGYRHDKIKDVFDHTVDGIPEYRKYYDEDPTDAL